jgi:hypothetical protein
VTEQHTPYKKVSYKKMVALDDLKAGDLIVSPWYDSKKLEFRVDDDDMIYTIDGGGIQRRIGITLKGSLLSTVGLLIYTIPRRGAAYLKVAKELNMLPPAEGVQKLGDTLTFESLGKPCTVATEEMKIRWGKHHMVQRTYAMPDGHGTLLAERLLPQHGTPSTHFYHTISINENQLRRK